MAFKHPLDPQTQWDAAARCGKMVAQSILAAEDVIPALLDAAVKAGWKGDLCGLQARLTWHVTDTADHWRRERDRTEYLIRNDIAPKIQARAPGAEILSAAQATNDRQGQPYTNREVWRLVNEILGEAIARMDQQVRQRGRRNAR